MTVVSETLTASTRTSMFSPRRTTAETIKFRLAGCGLSATDQPTFRAFLKEERFMLSDEVSLNNPNSLFTIGDHMTNSLGVTAMPFEDRQGQVYRRGRNHIAKADAHIEDFKHLSVGHVSVSLNQGEDRLGFNKSVDLKSDIGIYTRQIQ